MRPIRTLLAAAALMVSSCSGNQPNLAGQRILAQKECSSKYPNDVRHYRKCVERALSSPLDDFTQCITKRGVTFFEASWCPHCAKLDQMFGASSELRNRVQCSDTYGGDVAKECVEAGIDGYPTVRFEDGSRTGYHDDLLQEIAMKTRCKLPPL